MIAPLVQWELTNLQAVSEGKVRMHNAFFAQEIHSTGNLEGKVHLVLIGDRLHLREREREGERERERERERCTDKT